MRDKVKRFISILMTALMLVNLLPVGALADGFTISNSVQSIGWWGYPVFVYVQVDGDPTGLRPNKDGWFTIGMVANVRGMPAPQYSYSAYQSSVNGIRPGDIIGNITRFTDNTDINIGDIFWEGKGFKVDSGTSGSYPEYDIGPRWHLDGTIKIQNMPSTYTVLYVDVEDGKEIGRGETVTGKMHQTEKVWVDAPDSLEDGLYSFCDEVEGYPQMRTQKVPFTEQNGTLTFYYKKNTYTVNYYLNGTTEKVKPSTTTNAKLDDIVTATHDTIDGYTITPESNKVKSTTITKGTNEINFYYYKNVELTANSDTATYDGTLKSVSGFTGAPEGITFDGITEPSASGTDVGTYPAEFAEGTVGKVDTTEKYIVTAANPGTLKITPQAIKVTVTGNTDTKVYNGKLQSVVDFTTDAPEGVTVRLKTGKEAKAEGQNVGTYPMGLTEEDFEVESPNYAVELSVNDGKLEITPVTDKVTVTIKGGKSSVTYNGEDHTVTGYTVADISNPLYKEANFTFSGNAEAKGKNADLYKMGLKAADFANTSNNFKNVEFVVSDGQLEITKRPVKLTSADLTKVYDGTALKNGDTPVKEEFGMEDAFPEGEGVTYTFKGSQTNAGSSKNTFTYAWNEGTNKDNYTIYQVEGDLVVTPIDGIKVTITGRKDTQTYDGKEHSVFGFDAEPSNALYNPKEDMQFNGTDVDMTAKGTDAGTYPMKLTAEHFTNKSNNFTNVTFVVTDGYVKITPRAVTLTSETAGKTYDGTALEKPVVTVGGDGFVEGQVKEIKATGSVTNAGSVANTITFTPDKETFKEGNYAITKNEGTLTIAKRSVLITSQSATKTYDGSALTRPAVTITGDGFVPGELAKVEATGSITNVGSTPNAIQYTTTGAFNPANYSIALSVGTLTVTAKPEPEPRRTFNLTVNYVYQNGKRAAASYNRGGLRNGETFDITSPVIVGYTASETVVSGTIDNRDIKVTVIYTADGVNLDDYGVPLGLGNITMNVGDCFE